MDGVKLSEVDKVKCPSCGASMTFSPEIGGLKCDHCGRVDVEKKVYADERDFFSAEPDRWEEEACAYKCDSCYAVTVFKKGEIATNCPFCGASNVLSLDSMVGVKPNAVIPFALSKEQAKVHYKKWIKKKLYAPRKVKKDFVADNVNGIYVPCWTYDTNTHSTYVGRFGEYYYVTVGSGKNRRTVRRTRWYSVHGDYDEGFDDIIVQSGSIISQKDLQSVMPFNTRGAVRYDTKYLSGFTAERYSLGVRDGYENAKSYMSGVIRNRITSHYHPDVIDYLNINTTYSDITFKYLLLPVWRCSFKYKDRDYGFLVNGETGKTKGRAPVSALKVLMTILGALAVVGAIALVYLL